MLRAADTDMKSHSSGTCTPRSACCATFSASAAQASASTCSLYFSLLVLVKLRPEHRLEGDNWITAAPLHLGAEDRDLRRDDLALVGGLAAVAPAVRDRLSRARHRATRERTAPRAHPGTRAL